MSSSCTVRHHQEDGAHGQVRGHDRWARGAHHHPAVAVPQALQPGHGALLHDHPGQVDHARDVAGALGAAEGRGQIPAYLSTYSTGWN
jgi:hypothetical protein